MTAPRPAAADDGPPAAGVPLADHLAYGATLLLGVATAAMAAGYPRPAEAHSGPGSFPFALGCLMVLVAILGWLTSGKRARAGGAPPADAGDDEAAAPGRPSQSALLAGATALYLLLMPTLGFISATAVLGAGSLHVLGERDLARALAIGFLFAFALYGVFGILMNVALPQGVLG